MTIMINSSVDNSTIIGDNTKPFVLSGILHAPPAEYYTKVCHFFNYGHNNAQPINIRGSYDPWELADEPNKWWLDPLDPEFGQYPGAFWYPNSVPIYFMGLPENVAVVLQRLARTYNGSTNYFFDLLVNAAVTNPWFPTVLMFTQWQWVYPGDDTWGIRIRNSNDNLVFDSGSRHKLLKIRQFINFQNSIGGSFQIDPSISIPLLCLPSLGGRVIESGYNTHFYVQGWLRQGLTVTSVWIYVGSNTGSPIWASDSQMITPGNSLITVIDGADYL